MIIAIAVTNEVPYPVPGDSVFPPYNHRIELAQELARRGHKISVYCSSDSILPSELNQLTAGLPSVYSQRKASPEEDLGIEYTIMTDQALFSCMAEAANRKEFDIILHIQPLQFIHYVRFLKIPTVFSVHDNFNRRFQLLENYKDYPNHYYVAISNYQRQTMPNLNWLATIHNTLDIERVPFSEKAGDYAMIIGRITPEKGIDQSLEIAKRAGLKPLLAGFIQNQQYYAEKVSPLLQATGGQYLGSLERADLLGYLKMAKVLINYVDWHEPFGNVVIEAMATGTPVIASRKGAFPEILTDPRCSFIADSIEEAATVAADYQKFDRHRCREFVAENFSVKKAADQYVTILEEAIRLNQNTK